MELGVFSFQDSKTETLLLEGIGAATFKSYMILYPPPVLNTNTNTLLLIQDTDGPMRDTPSNKSILLCFQEVGNLMQLNVK